MVIGERATMTFNPFQMEPPTRKTAEVHRHAAGEVTELGEVRVQTAAMASTASTAHPSHAKAPCEARNGGCKGGIWRSGGTEPRTESPWHSLKTVFLLSVIVAFLLWIIVYTLLDQYRILWYYRNHPRFLLWSTCSSPLWLTFATIGNLRFCGPPGELHDLSTFSLPPSDPAFLILQSVCIYRFICDNRSSKWNPWSNSKGTGTPAAWGFRQSDCNIVYFVPSYKCWTFVNIRIKYDVIHSTLLDYTRILLLSYSSRLRIESGVKKWKSMTNLFTE